jgi:hypothetical protein
VIDARLKKAALHEDDARAVCEHTTVAAKATNATGKRMRDKDCTNSAGYTRKHTRDSNTATEEMEHSTDCMRSGQRTAQRRSLRLAVKVINVDQPPLP